MSSAGRIAGRTLGRYRVGSVIGQGGMGEVYRADDTELRRSVAIKVLPESLTGEGDRLARFIQEARTASALNHPHLVSIYEIGHAAPDGEGVPVHFIAMELVHGETLRQLINARRLDLRKALEYLVQAADALAAAHAAGIIHRDLKPDNVMVADAGYAKVLDFGLAKLRGEHAIAGIATNDPTVTRLPGAEPPATSPGVVMGTVGYMSPEQAQGLPVDHRSDIFSFGCILYEVATGARPFAGSSAVDTLHKIINAQPAAIAQLVPSTPNELQRIIRKCLAKAPDERYQSMKDLALDLRDLRRELDSGSNVSVAPVPAGTAPHSRLWMAAGALLLVGIAAAAYWGWRPRSGASPRQDLAIERITSTGLVIDAAISGDGKYVTYVHSEGGKQSLWLRQLRGGRPLQLAAPEGGFWGVRFNPDATTIYYAIKNAAEPSGTLYSIPVLGGSPRVVLTGIDSTLTFSPDGTRIAYYRVNSQPRGTSSLMIAGAGGEDPKALLTKSAPEFLAPAFFVAPSWSPDGAFIAGAVRNSQTHGTRLALFSVRDATEQTFPFQYAEATFTSWIPDGSGIVLVARLPSTPSNGNGGQLWLQPYPSGEPRRLTSDMLEYRNATFTSDSQSLLTVGFEGSTRLSITSVNGANERYLPEDRTAGLNGVTWSPDGQRIFYLKAVREIRQLWTMAIDGSDAREVIGNAGWGGVAVSPDGRAVVYTAERNGTRGIFLANVDGTGERMLAPVEDANRLMMAPDKREVYFTSLRDGSGATYRLPLDGGPPSLLAAGLERAVPSPDGRLLAGVYRASPEAAITIGIIDAATGRVVNTIGDFAAPTGSGGFEWQPDGKTVIFTTAERFNLFSQPAMGGPREKLTNFNDQWIVRYAMSPDRKSVLFCRGTALRDAVLMTGFR